MILNEQKCYQKYCQHVLMKAKLRRLIMNFPNGSFYRVQRNDKDILMGGVGGASSLRKQGTAHSKQMNFKLIFFFLLFIISEKKTMMNDLSFILQNIEFCLHENEKYKNMNTNLFFVCLIYTLKLIQSKVFFGQTKMQQLS